MKKIMMMIVVFGIFAAPMSTVFASNNLNGLTIEFAQPTGDEGGGYFAQPTGDEGDISPFAQPTGDEGDLVVSGFAQPTGDEEDEPALFAQPTGDEEDKPATQPRSLTDTIYGYWASFMNFFNKI